MAVKNNTTYRIEAFCKNGIMFFDFGFFAIVVKWSYYTIPKYAIRAYFGDQYSKIFMKARDMILGDFSVNEVLRNPDEIKEIKRVFKEWDKIPNKVPFEKLWDLLRKSFPEYTAKTY